MIIDDRVLFIQLGFFFLFPGGLHMFNFGSRLCGSSSSSSSSMTIYYLFKESTFNRYAIKLLVIVL